MATTVEQAGAAARRKSGFDEVWDQPRGFFGIFHTIDNIPIARRYMVTSFAFFLIGGALALLMRIQLGTPENTFLDPETYNQIFTMHGTTMMFLFVIPFLEAFANYLIPLLNGTRDLPFPRLTALSYWTYLFGGLFIYSSFLFGLAPDGGWFAYVPLTSKEYSPGLNMDFWDIGLSVAEVAAIGAAAEMIVGILRTRAPGMSLNRMPVFSWAMLVTSFMIIFAFTPLVVGTAMLELDRKEITRFFDPDYGGEPLLWQHIFWVFGHPEVYIMFVPAVGIVSQVVQTFSRRPLMSYTLMVLAIIATGFISFGLWVHHMFATGLSAVAMGFFAAASMVIAIPNGVQVFGWIATMWAGRPAWRTPLLFVVGFLIIFVVGGITGVMVAAVPFDWQAHDSYFVVAHFHYVLIGGVVFPLFAGLYYWVPKLSGRLLSERLGWWNFALMFVGFNVAFGPMHVTGLLGMPRRVYTYPQGLGFETYNLVSSIGAFVFAAGVLLFLVNLGYSLRRGAAAGKDPWGGDTLEWSERSPPENAQFPRLPIVRSRHPLWDQSTLAVAADDDPDVVSAAQQLDRKPDSWRGTLIVDVLDGRPRAIAHMPRRSVWPFVMAVGFTILFAAALLDDGPVALAGLLVTVVAIAGWFWPLDTERIAIEETGADEHAAGAPPTDAGSRGTSRLPLAVGDRSANGWWGTCVLLCILATALATLVASYFYLGDGPSSAPTISGRPLMLAMWAAVVALLAAAATRWLTHSVDHHRTGSRRLAIGAAMVLHAAAQALAVSAFRDLGLQPAESGFASGVLGLTGFATLAAVGAMAMLAAALLWAWRAPNDPRGRGVALNTALVSYFAAAAWLVAFATIYLSPRFL